MKILTKFDAERKTPVSKRMITAVTCIYIFCPGMIMAQTHWEDNTLHPQTYTSGTVDIGVAPGPTNSKLRVLASNHNYAAIFRNNSTISSPGSRYGIYVELENTAVTTPNYGLYSSVPVNNQSWAGYFLGNGYFSNALGINTNTPNDARLEVKDGNIVLSGQHNRFVLHHQWWNGTSNAFMIAPYNSALGQWEWSNGLKLHTSGLFEVRNASVNETLKVQEKIWAKAMEVKLPPFPDYVFDSTYTLMSIDSLQAFIRMHGHLPGLEPASVIDSREGYDVGTFLTQQMQKVEELTLYIIRLHAEIEILKKSGIQH